MAEEMKQEEKKTDAKKMFSTALKFLLGFAFLILGLLAIISWRRDLLLVVKGCIGLFFILAGIITLAIARE